MNRENVPFFSPLKTDYFTVTHINFCRVLSSINYKRNQARNHKNIFFTTITFINELKLKEKLSSNFLGGKSAVNDCVCSSLGGFEQMVTGVVVS